MEDDFRNSCLLVKNVSNSCSNIKSSHFNQSNCKKQKLNITPYQYMIKGIRIKNEKNNIKNQSISPTSPDIILKAKNRPPIKLSLNIQSVYNKSLPRIPKHKSLFQNYKLTMIKQYSELSLNHKSKSKISLLTTETNVSTSKTNTNTNISTYTKTIKSQNKVKHHVPLDRIYDPIKKKRIIETFFNPYKRSNSLVNRIWNTRQGLLKKEKPIFIRKDKSSSAENYVNKSQSPTFQQIDKMTIMPNVLWKTVLNSQAMISDIENHQQQTHSNISKKIKMKDSLILLREIILSYNDSEYDTKRALATSFLRDRKILKNQSNKTKFVIHFIRYLKETPSNHLDLDDFIGKYSA